MKKGLLVLLIVAAAGYAVTAPPPGPRTMADFDPYRLADLERQMWEAYYAQENVRLFRLLVLALREQYNVSWLTAISEAFRLAQATAAFATMQSNYMTLLPDLEAAYAALRDSTGTSFDPAEVARAELAWWVARRTPGKDSPQQVGRLIAQEYALLYEVSPSSVLGAGVRRAEAAALRDEQATAPDWERIGNMLADSYVELHAAVQP